MVCFESSAFELPSDLSESEFQRIIQNTDGEISRKDHLHALVEMLRPTSEIGRKRKESALFALLDLYIPRESMYEWKGDSFLSFQDMVDFVNSRDRTEIDKWLFDREEMVYQMETKKYRLKIGESKYRRIENRGISELSVSEILMAAKNELRKRGEPFNILKINVVQAKGYEDWLTLLIYSNRSGDSRIFAMINAETFIHDIVKEESGF